MRMDSEINVTQEAQNPRSRRLTARSKWSKKSASKERILLRRMLPGQLTQIALASEAMTLQKLLACAAEKGEGEGEATLRRQRDHSSCRLSWLQRCDQYPQA